MSRQVQTDDYGLKGTGTFYVGGVALWYFGFMAAIPKKVVN